MNGGMTIVIQITGTDRQFERAKARIIRAFGRRFEKAPAVETIHKIPRLGIPVKWVHVRRGPIVGLLRRPYADWYSITEAVQK